MKAEYLDHMGDDLAVVNAAKVSMAEVGIEFDDEDHGRLIKYLARGMSASSEAELIDMLSRETDKDAIKAAIWAFRRTSEHWTPFAHTAIKLRMSAPVPIRTQCFKHKAGFVENEESRRYIKSTPEIYFPDEWRMAADNVKQGSGGVHPLSSHWSSRYIRACRMAMSEYEAMIEDGICPEQARFVLPQGAIVNWIWTGNLAGFARFVNQRTDPHAQKEARDLANMVSDIISPLFPVSWGALT